jgi:hypothetical protein
VCRCLTSLAMLRFHFPLIEPDRRISRIRLSDWIHPATHGRKPTSIPVFVSGHSFSWNAGSF